MKWFRFYSEFRHDTKLKRMPIAHRYAFVILLCLANDQEQRGVISKLDDEDIAFELEMEQDDWQTLKAKFRVRGMIDFNSKGEIIIINWDKRQFSSDTSSARVSKHRDKKKKQACNVTETLLKRDVTPPDTDPDPDPDADPDTERDPITHADPYRADAKKSADAERVCEEGCLSEISVLEPEPEQSEPLASITPPPDLLEKHGISRVGEFSGGVVSQSTQNFNDRWNYSSDIAPVTDELIRLYNNGKPDNWTGIVGDSRRARRKIQDMALKYQGTGGKLDELPEMMKKALLWYGGSDFHTKKEFGSGDIFWLCEQERVEIAAAKWAGSGESVKRKVATAILERENGVKHWKDGHLMSQTELVIKARSIPKMLLNHPDLPPHSWVKKNMPEILNKLDPNYPREELNYACN
jgi:hypothetical protein